MHFNGIFYIFTCLPLLCTVVGRNRNVCIMKNSGISWKYYEFFVASNIKIQKKYTDNIKLLFHSDNSDVLGSYTKIWMYNGEYLVIFYSF